MDGLAPVARAAADQVRTQRVHHDNLQRLLTSAVS